MPVDTITAFRAWDLPSEGALGYAAIKAQIASAKLSLRLFMYSFTDAGLCDALGDAHDRGVDVKCLFDHSESVSPEEVALLHRFFLRVPPSFSRITTSPFHQIMHRKELCVDGAADVPDAQFENVDEATAVGYPRTITGSTNWSPTAFRQTNDLICIPGKSYAAIVMQQFNLLWAWISINEPQYNVLIPVAADVSTSSPGPPPKLPQV